MVKKMTKLNLRKDSYSDKDYLRHVEDLIKNEFVLSMKKHIQHSNVSCFQHCLSVSYKSYQVCKRLGFDYRSAARGGLLHDFFLYDWHIPKSHKGLHGFNHSYLALQNANKHFNLNETEKDIIEKHMWPMTIKLPKYKEALVVALVDKYCSSLEILKLNSIKDLPKLDLKKP